MSSSSLPADSRAPHHAVAAGEEPPPFLGTWRRVYLAVLLYLLGLILLFSLFTHAFRVPS